MFLQNLFSWNSPIGGRDFGKWFGYKVVKLWLGYEDRTLMNAKCALKKEAQRVCLLLYHVNSQLEVSLWKIVSHNTVKLLRFWSTPQPPELQEVKFCCLSDTQPIVICYSNLNRQRYPLSQKNKPKTFCVSGEMAKIGITLDKLMDIEVMNLPHILVTYKSDPYRKQTNPTT
jgi:hypothetical protein